MTAPRIPRRSAYIPAGADQQGRLRETGVFVQAAEAANDIGTEPDAEEPDFRRAAWRALVLYLAACVLVTAATAAVIFGSLS